MSTPGNGLERRYRRLLISYPLRFRDEHGEELLAVLIDAARDGQRFPTPRDAADLVAHGFLARVRSRQLTATPSAARERPLTYGDAWARSLVHGLGPAPVGSWLLPGWLKRLAALVVVLAIVVSTGLAIRYVFFDQALAGYGGSATATATVEQTTYLGLPARPAGSTARSTALDLRSVSPHLAANTAQATVTVLVCTGPPWTAAALVYGGASLTAAADCTRLSPFRSGAIRLGTSSLTAQGTTGVLVAVTPHHSGIVRIEGADVTYRQGIRYGHQHVGADWTLHVP